MTSQPPGSGDVPAQPPQVIAAPDARLGMKKPNHYVGIGASAGGLEAIQSFFKNVQANSNLAYIVIQHLSPDYKSLMVELLAKVTSLPIHRAEEGMVVEADNIYLIPPGKNLKIFHGALLLSQQARDGVGINLPIDIFLTSLAEDSGGKSIGVILSGAGSDGTRGCRAIKEVGGMVMVQEVSTAKFDPMPQSVIQNGLADFILSPEEMPLQLLAFSRHPFAARGSRDESLIQDNSGLSRIFSLLREKSKIDFTFYKPSTIVRRIERRMTVNQVNSLQEYIAYLEAHPNEQNVLYRELLIGVTSFFRDPEMFDLLRSKWLPERLTAHSGDEFRVWITGCSTGEEAYSYAILCSEILEKLELRKDVKIFATDVDADAIATASVGEYPASITADIPNDLLAKYFIRRGDRFQVSRSLREMVVFARHNIVGDPPFTNIELVSCRNMMIYLQSVLQNRVLESLNFSLHAGGILVLGTSESLGESEHLFEALSTRWKIFRAYGTRKPLLHTERFTRANLYKNTRPTLYRDSHPIQQIYEEERILGRFVEALADGPVPFAMIINEEQNLLYVIGDGRNYLMPPSGKVVSDVRKLVSKDLAIPISTGLSKVFSANAEISFTNVRVGDGDVRKMVDIRIKPLPEQRGKSRLAAVFISESGFNLSPIRLGDAEQLENYDLSREAEQRIRDLEQELQFTRENLQASIEELETANEELQATNEELLASNEELQSTNEELHSVNEELFTVNAEHQNKITELTELNNDLDNYVNATDVISIFLDENLDLRRFTANTNKVFNILDQDLGRPLSHISHSLTDCELSDLVALVNTTGELLERHVQTQAGRWYQLRIRPYLVSARTQAGVAIVLNDITTLKTLQDDLARAKKRYDFAQETARVGTWEWTLNSNQLIWSDNIEPMFGLMPGKFDGTYDFVLGCIHPEDRERVRDTVHRSIADKTSYVVEYRVPWPDGVRTIWVSETGQLTQDEKGIEKMAGLVRDITDRREAEDRLRRSEGQYKASFARAPLGMVHFTPDGVIIAANPTLSNILGYSEGELTGLHFPDLAEAESARVAESRFSRLISGQDQVVQVEMRMVHKGGAVRETRVTLTATRGEGNVPEMIIGMVEDVTDRRSTETLLKYNEDLVSAIVSSAPAGFGLIRGDRLDWANERVSHITQYAVSELSGMPLNSLFDSEVTFDRSRLEEILCQPGNADAMVSATWRRKDGTPVKIVMSLQALDTKDNEEIYVFSALEADRLFEINMLCPLENHICPLTSTVEQSITDTDKSV